MAFCPECGKAVTGAEAKCGQCGKTLPYQANKPGAPRFKGTVMMAAPTGASASIAPMPTVPAMAPAVAVGMRPDPEPAPAKRAATHGVQAVSAKATMVGPGVAPQASVRPANVAARDGLAAERVQQLVHVAVSPAPQPPESAARVAARGTRPSPLLALQQTARPEGSTERSEPPVLVEARPPEPVSDTRAVGEAVTAPRIERPQQFLPGDPMAPQPPSAATRAGHSARLRLHGHDTGGYAVPKSERKWLYWAVCGVVLLSVLVLTIGLF